LTNTIVDRHLLSNLTAINVRIIQIPVTIEYDIKEYNIKPTTEIYNTTADNIMCD
jgi:hypothetical protein